MLSWAGIAFIMAWAAAAPGPLDSPGCRPPVRDAMGSSSTLSSDEGKLGGNPGGFFLIGLMLLLFCCLLCIAILVSLARRAGLMFCIMPVCLEAGLKVPPLIKVVCCGSV